MNESEDTVPAHRTGCLCARCEYARDERIAKADVVSVALIEERVKELRESVTAHGCILGGPCERCWGNVCAADELEKFT